MYSLEFTDKQAEEIDSLTSGVFEFDPSKPQPRRLWLAVAQMAKGKAELMDDGYYHDGDDEELEPEGYEDEPDVWAADLRAIADIITDKFKPGDGQL